MRARLLDIRPEERQSALAAFFTLLGITAGHTLLETARDALFLARLPASQLPWVYLGIAAAGLLMAELNKRRSSTAQSRYTLSISLAGSAAITVVFWALSGLKSAPFLYALYLWTGIFASWVVVQFWMLLGNLYTVVQAKRIFGAIGTGSVLGAVAGAAGARALAGLLEADHLLLGAAALLLATAFGPGLALAGSVTVAPPAEEKKKAVGSIADDLRLVLGHAYVKRILVMILLATVTVTIVDYLFKAAVAERVPKEELGAFFATVYVYLNAIALVVQLFAVGAILRTFGVQRAVLIMPALIVLFASGVIAGGGLIAALALKGSDGSLRHSLQRTSTELLFVPIPDAIRGRAKPFIDLIGQRGGQAVASLAILGMVWLGAGELALAIAISALGAAWIAIAIGLRRHYLDLFRSTLREGRVDDRGDLPELDLTALEALFAGLNSRRDAEVVCALEILAAQRRQRLIPALILYHPSRTIVLRALELFAREGRTDFLPICDRLLVGADIEVRAAALRAHAAVAFDEAFMRGKLEDSCLEVRATALVGLISRGSMSGEEASSALQVLVSGAPAVRIALAKAIAQDPSPRFDDVLERLIASSEPEVRLEAAWAIGRMKSEKFVPKLIPLLAETLESAGARDALVEIGAPALAALDRAMSDPSLSLEVRWSIPRAISLFSPAEAGPILVRHLEQDADGMLRFRILRGLRRLRASDPEVSLDKRALWRVVEQTVKKAFELISWRLAIEKHAKVDPAKNTPALQLIIALLKDKEVHAIGRVMRLFGLVFPRENFERIQRGLTSNNPKARASSRELIENLVQPPLRAHVIALIDDVSDVDRLDRAVAPFKPEPADYESLIAAFVDRDDELGTLAAYHATQAGMRVAPKRGTSESRGLMASLIESAAATTAGA